MALDVATCSLSALWSPSLMAGGLCASGLLLMFASTCVPASLLSGRTPRGRRWKVTDVGSSIMNCCLIDQVSDRGYKGHRSHSPSMKCLTRARLHHHPSRTEGALSRACSDQHTNGPLTANSPRRGSLRHTEMIMTASKICPKCE